MNWKSNQISIALSWAAELGVFSFVLQLNQWPYKHVRIDRDMKKKVKEKHLRLSLGIATEFVLLFPSS